MSEFDREAEREKLREQYERDKQKRKASEKMSELLLQGATMTNRHCPDCQSPVFRYDEREFCPTCEREVPEESVARDVETDSNGEQLEDTKSKTTAKRESSTPGPSTDDRRPADSGDMLSEDISSIDEQDAEVSAGDHPETDSLASQKESLPAVSGRQEAQLPDSISSDHMTEIEASLLRTLTELTNQAEDTADVSRKRQLLAAAREAAETLAALRQI